MKKYVKEYKGHKVPDGAKYYNDRSKCFYNEGKDKYYHCEVSNGWRTCMRSSVAASSSNTTELPESPQEWMPKVGVECEGYFENMIGYTDWHEVRILTKENYKYAVACQGNDFLSWCENVRPLKTAEEKKREAFYLSVVDACMGIHKDDFNVDEIAGVLYHAGFTAPKAEK